MLKIKLTNSVISSPKNRKPPKTHELNLTQYANFISLQDNLNQTQKKKKK